MGPEVTRSFGDPQATDSMRFKLGASCLFRATKNEGQLLSLLKAHVIQTKSHFIYTSLTTVYPLNKVQVCRSRDYNPISGCLFVSPNLLDMAGASSGYRGR